MPSGPCLRPLTRTLRSEPSSFTESTRPPPGPAILRKYRRPPREAAGELGATNNRAASPRKSAVLRRLDIGKHSTRLLSKKGTRYKSRVLGIRAGKARREALQIARDSRRT